MTDIEREWLTPGVSAVGAASLFSDLGHEMTTSTLPTFVTATLHSGPGALGVIEGVSDALIGVAKLAGGPLAVDPERRGRLVQGGYVGTALATGAIGLTVAIWQVAILRGVAWISRGIRSPARDAVLYSLVPASAYGRASGLERAGDNLGAVGGPLLAALLVATIGIRPTLLVATVPGFLAAVAIAIAAREAKHRLGSSKGRKVLSYNLGELRRAGLLRVLVAPAFFEFGNLAASLLILRCTVLLHTDGRSLAHATSIAVLLYAAHNLAATGTAIVAGGLIDRASPRQAMGLGAVTYLIGYAVFAVGPHQIAWLLVGFVMAGAGIGFAEPAESAAIAVLLPDELRPNGFGCLGVVQGIGALTSSAVVGLLWAHVSAEAGFFYAAAWMLAALLAAPMLTGSSESASRPV
ncbi:MAG: MFS transporter [Frankiaceae bacterium]|nr:MFS transporter [Frankiaceae bacterium]MBV9870508.1 MFS transporter [Frankiaceae bacterium]